MSHVLRVAFFVAITIAAFFAGRSYERERWTNMPPGACIPGQMLLVDGRVFLCSRVFTWGTSE